MVHNSRNDLCCFQVIFMSVSRIYDAVLMEHFDHLEQMLFLVGPRQVGKTTLGKLASQLTDRFLYLNWDNVDDKMRIMEGPKALITLLQTEAMQSNKAYLVLDEFHKYKKWRIYIKGLYDSYKSSVNILLTGSAKLNIYKRGGDSLRGRYFSFRIHPLSLSELHHTDLPLHPIRLPTKPEHDSLSQLMTYGGFPDPWTQQNQRFYNRWQQSTWEQLFHYDIRDLSQIHESSLLELLAKQLQHQAGQLVNYSNLANKIGVSVHTIQSWCSLLKQIFYCFTIQPWTSNVARTLLKQPKVYLWDWSLIADPGARYENLIASHLLKAIHFWEDYGLGRFGLYFLRDKEQREVDFLVTKDEKPWFLVEAKTSDKNSLSPSLAYFQQCTGAEYAFQVVLNKPYIEQDCFQYTQPIIVPAETFLSQLI